MLAIYNDVLSIKIAFQNYGECCNLLEIVYKLLKTLIIGYAIYYIHEKV